MDDFASTFGSRIKCALPTLLKSEKLFAQNGPYANPLGDNRTTILIPTDCVKTLVIDNITDYEKFFEINSAGKVQVIPISAKTKMKYHLTDAQGGKLRGCMIQAPEGVYFSLESSPGSVPMFDPMDVFMKNEALKSHTQAKWISVEESLPEMDLEVDIIAEGYFGKKSVLAQSKERHQFTAQFNPYNGWHIWNIFTMEEPKKVLCWKYIDEETRKILDFKKEEKNEN